MLRGGKRCKVIVSGCATGGCKVAQLEV